MTGFLQALPTTPLRARVEREGRLLPQTGGRGNFKPPNFRTAMPLDALLAGGRRMLQTIYEPATYFDRALRSLDEWQPSPHQHPPPSQTRAALRRTIVQSIVRQGLRSTYRREYWKYLFQIVKRWRHHPLKRWQGFVMLISAHHFLLYARDVIGELDEQLRAHAAPEPLLAATGPVV
jgi:hypothetical protein